MLLSKVAGGERDCSGSRRRQSNPEAAWPLSSAIGYCTPKDLGFPSVIAEEPIEYYDEMFDEQFLYQVTRNVE
jgi:hypothetical protein